MPDNAFVYPKPGALGATLGRIASYTKLLRLRRVLFSKLPFLTLESDISDVVYLTWVVEVAPVSKLTPPGVKLWEKDGKTLFTILSYSHGHFGPSAAGALRRLFPSPLQSNWRLYVDELPGAVKADRTVLFVKNIMDSALYAIGTRLFSDALPTHLALSFAHQRAGHSFETSISGGVGSAPDFHCIAHRSTTPGLPPQFESLFPSWSSAVEFLCLQDSAIAAVDDVSRIAEAGIEIPIDLETVLPLEVDPASRGSDLVRSIADNQVPLCFAVPQVKFRVIWERLR